MRDFIFGKHAEKFEFWYNPLENVSDLVGVHDLSIREDNIAMLINFHNIPE